MNKILTLMLSTVLAAGCAAKGTVGTPVTLKILDEQEEPIPTAVIRHPEEADRHRVNAVDGSWTDEVLYMADGSELIFEPGLMLVFECSAAGYETQVIQYQVRRRKNDVIVSLRSLEFDEDTIEEPMMSFGRDNPRGDTVGGGPAN